jgi:branched-subunit amino acid aminotransferase/4-amino-4-deoxychorismate lyase
MKKDISMTQQGFVTEIDGRAASAEQLAPLAFAGFAHFTAMQVRGGQIRGLDLHLERLRLASETLFGRALDDDRVRARLRSAIEAGPEDLSLTATVYSPAGEFTVAGADVEPAVLVRTGPPSSGPAGPLRLMPVEHERSLAAIKHVGEGAKTHFLRKAVAQGFDDAAFVDRHGRLGEATIWNLVFWDGEAVVWPEADILLGTSMGIVRRQLSRLGIAQRVRPVTPAEVRNFAGAAVMNSWSPGIAVNGIGPTALPAAPAFLELLHRAYRAEPLARP